MKAVITCGPPPSGPYCDLPILDAHPKIFYSLGGERFYADIDGGDYSNCYCLAFERTGDSGVIHAIEEITGLSKPELSDEQIRKINELYFYMLDNKDIVEGRVDI